MKKLFNTVKPNTIEEYGVGTMLYNYNIEQGVQNEKEGYFYNSQVFEKPLCYENIVRAIIHDNYSHDEEKKLINDYNAVIEGLLPEEKKAEYLEFLSFRSRIKEQVKADLL